MSRNNKPRVPYGIYTGEEDKCWFDIFFEFDDISDYSDYSDSYRNPLWFWEV